jgi:hypothetical protein
MRPDAEETEVLSPTPVAGIYTAEHILAILDAESEQRLSSESFTAVADFVQRAQGKPYELPKGAKAQGQKRKATVAAGKKGGADKKPAKSFRLKFAKRRKAKAAKAMPISVAASDLRRNAPGRKAMQQLVQSAG